jgi:DNA processing protein
MVSHIFPPEHPAYPALLRSLVGRGTPAAGDSLFTRGAWPPKVGIAVVGTREPTEAGVSFARAIAFSIVEAGWAVWSGGARGIDAAVHEAAMERGGTTVVVSPSGLDVPYPPEHEDLFARVVASGGTLLAPFADHARPKLASFHKRNAVLAALTLATVVVQAGKKSGARSTARAARRFGRPLYVVPHAPWEEKGIGCALEMERGARVLTSGEGLVASLRGEPLRARRAAHVTEVVTREHTYAHALQELGEDTTRVFEAIQDMPMHADDLCDRTALPFSTVTAALLTLTLQAVVVEAPAGFYRRQNCS